MRAKLFSALAAALGMLIGAGGCDDGSGSDGTGGSSSGTGGTGGTGGSSSGTGGAGNYTAEYGMPYAQYVVSGHVEDANGDPINGIELALGANTYEPAHSGPDGTWSIDTSGSFCHPDCTVEATDVDGADNGGLYEPKTVDITLTQTDPGSGTWDEGTWEVHDVAIQLDLASGGSGGGGSGGAGGT